MKQIIRTISLAVALCASLPAQAGPFEDFFQPSAPGIIEDTIPANTPRIIPVGDQLDANVRQYWEQGYAILGVSEFVGRPTDPKKATSKAKKLKAEVVLFSAIYLDTRSGGTVIMPMPMGMPGAMATPISFQRYHQTAIFLSKTRPEKMGIGIQYKPLSVDQAQAIGTNKGIFVDVVVRGSAAYDADLMSGDIILRVADQDFSTTDRMSRVKADYAGQTVPVEIIRGGQSKTLQISLPPVAAPTR